MTTQHPAHKGQSSTPLPFGRGSSAARLQRLATTPRKRQIITGSSPQGRAFVSVDDYRADRSPRTTFYYRPTPASMNRLERLLKLLEIKPSYFAFFPEGPTMHFDVQGWVFILPTPPLPAVGTKPAPAVSPKKEPLQFTLPQLSLARRRLIARLKRQAEGRPLRLSPVSVETIITEVSFDLAYQLRQFNQMAVRS